LRKEVMGIKGSSTKSQRGWYKTKKNRDYLVVVMGDDALGAFGLKAPGFYQKPAPKVSPSHLMPIN
jgi:hypothetical protein